MDREDAKQRRMKKFEEIKLLIAESLVPDIDLDEEANTVIDAWLESTDDGQCVPAPTNRLEELLSDYQKLSEVVWQAPADDPLVLALDAVEQTAASIRAQIDTLLAGVDPSPSIRDVVFDYLFASTITPATLEWLARGQGPASVRLNAAVLDWIAAPEYR